MRFFYESHPNLPEWFQTSTMCIGSKIGELTWQFSISAYPRSSLGSDETWEETEHGYKFVRTNPATGERKVVISGGHFEKVHIFEAMVDFKNKEINVISDNVVKNFYRKDFLPLRKL